jgi:diguanylate cyclase (GGDEF)-like protein
LGALTGLVVAVAVLCLGVSLASLSAVPARYAVVLVAAAALIAVGNGASVPIRLRTQQRLSVTSAGLLVLAVILPAAWVVVCSALGVLVARLVTRYRIAKRWHKAAYNVAKEVIAASAVVGVVHLLGVHPVLQGTDLVVGGWQEYLPAMLFGALTYAVVEEVLIGAAVSLSTGQPWLRVARRDLDVRVAGRICGLLIAAVTLALLRVTPEAIVGLPAASLVLYVVHVHRLHVRTERQVWARLAAATGALAAATAEHRSLPDVLAVATRRARSLFGLSAEIELWAAGLEQLVRVEVETRAGIDRVAGSPAGLAICALVRANGESMGALRLLLPHCDGLTPREDDLLRVYGTAVANAIEQVDTYRGLSAQAEAAHQRASRDPLTALANRRALQEAGEGWLAGAVLGGRPALLLLDLDGFKKVNDTLGHQAGDRLLVAVADRLRRVALRFGAVAGRLGGDEFAVLLVVPGPGLAAISRAETVLSCLSDPIELDGFDGGGVKVRGSAGLAIAEPGMTFASLLGHADHAMYQAKRGRHPLVLYTPSMALTGDGRPDALVSELSRAVDDRAVAIHVQPIVDLATGRVVAGEVIPRWSHPDHGVVQVPVWAELVERSPNPAAVCGYLVDKAVEAAARWQQAGLDVPVLVTVSPRCLLDQHFGHLVLGALDLHGVEPARLALGFSEALGISDAPVVDRVARLLRRRGVQLAVDDFGTGPNSLAAPRRLHLDQLLIRPGFDPNSLVVTAAIRLGMDQRFVVTARGVTTERQRYQLLNAGCRRGQGDLICASLPVAEFLRRVVHAPEHALLEPLPEPHDGQALAAPRAPESASGRRHMRN